MKRRVHQTRFNLLTAEQGMLRFSEGKVIWRAAERHRDPDDSRLGITNRDATHPERFVMIECNTDACGYAELECSFGSTGVAEGPNTS